MDAEGSAEASDSATEHLGGAKRPQGRARRSRAAHGGTERDRQPLSATWFTLSLACTLPAIAYFAGKCLPKSCLS